MGDDVGDGVCGRLGRNAALVLLEQQALLYTELNIKRLTFTSVRQEHFS